MYGYVLLTLCIYLSPLMAEAQTVSGPTPRTSYAEFFQALDLNLPELAPVKAAVDEADFKAAVSAFADYLRKREKPRWFFAPVSEIKAVESPDPNLLRKAEKVLQHRLTSVGIEHQFGPEIDWKYNPTYEPNSPYPHDNEWTWQLNRHWIWQTLGRAYRQTGDERYAREFVAQMTHWVRSCPVPVNRADQRPFSTWRTIEAGLRMAYSWPDAFYHFLRSPSFTDEALVTMVASFLEHARYLRAFPTRGNWLTMEMDGLYCVGVLFPEFREAPEWRRFAVETLRAELSRQVYPDGAQIELTPGYHDVALRNFLRPLYLARLNGYELPEDYIANLERMFAFLMWIMTPDRSAPRFNDAGHVDVPARLAEGARLFPKRRDFLWIATDGQDGEKPKELSHLFPYAGIAVMRSDWSRDANYMAVDGGPFGFGHQHEDKLSFVLYLHGVRFVADAGSYAYDASKWRRYVLSARGHNVIFVDGRGQRRRGLPRERYVVDAPVPLVWKTTESFDYFEAAYGGPNELFEGGRKARHTRRILYARSAKPEDEFWLVLDSLEPFDRTSHKYTSVFHLDVSEVRVDTSVQVLTAAKKGVGLRLCWAPLPGLSVRIVKGQEEPEVQGWVRDEPALRKMRAVATPHFEIECSGRTHLAYVFSADREGRRVVSLDWLGDPRDWRRPELRVSFSDGSAVVVRWVLEEAPPWDSGDWPRTISLTVRVLEPGGREKTFRLLP